MTSMPLLPDWLRVVWVVALGVVIVTHLWHAYCKRGQCRWWHAGHIVMAVGMAVMYWPGSMTRPAGLSRAGVLLFGGAALATATAAAVLRRREGALNLLWAAAAVDLLIMAYMWLPAAIRPSLLDYALAAYLGCQLLAWSLGLWERDPVIARRATAAPTMARAGTGRPAVARLPAPTTTGPSAAVGLVVHRAPVVRASLAVMAASMSYMLIVM